MNYRRRNHHRHSDWHYRMFVRCMAGLCFVGLIVLGIIHLYHQPGWVKQASVKEIPKDDPNFAKHLRNGDISDATNLPADVTVQGDTLRDDGTNRIVPKAGRDRIVATTSRQSGFAGSNPAVPKLKPKYRHLTREPYYSHSFFGTQDIRGSEAYKVALENSETLEK